MDVATSQNRKLRCFGYFRDLSHSLLGRWRAPEITAVSRLRVVPPVITPVDFDPSRPVGRAQSALRRQKDPSFSPFTPKAHIIWRSAGGRVAEAAASNCRITPASLPFTLAHLGRAIPPKVHSGERRSLLLALLLQKPVESDGLLMRGRRGYSQQIAGSRQYPSRRLWPIMAARLSRLARPLEPLLRLIIGFSQILGLLPTHRAVVTCSRDALWEMKLGSFWPLIPVTSHSPQI